VPGGKYETVSIFKKNSYGLGDDCQFSYTKERNRPNKMGMGALRNYGENHLYLSFLSRPK
jgi:hypothetical protein